MLLTGFLLPACALATNLNTRGDPHAPYLVRKGDTLWKIAGDHFGDPWKWKDIWELNKSSVRDPHWIYPGQLLTLELPAPASATASPAAPSQPPLEVQPMPKPVIAARVISVYRGASQAGQHTIVVINKGRRDGMENGLLLVLRHEAKPDGNQDKPRESSGQESSETGRADTGYGQLQVFRTFGKTSYASVTQATLPVKLLDWASTQ